MTPTLWLQSLVAAFGLPSELVTRSVAHAVFWALTVVAIFVWVWAEDRANRLNLWLSQVCRPAEVEEEIFLFLLNVAMLAALACGLVCFALGLLCLFSGR